MYIADDDKDEFFQIIVCMILSMYIEIHQLFNYMQ